MPTRKSIVDVWEKFFSGPYFKIYFWILAFANLTVLIFASIVAFVSAPQPYDFYVILHASYQIFNSPSMVYVYQYGSSTLGEYWSKWLWAGANYIYTPMFAFLLSPFSSFYPPLVKAIWEILSYSALVFSCTRIVRVVPWRTAKLFFPLMVFIMPLPLINAQQLLPQYWLSMWAWISPSFFADYYWGNTNTMILSLALLSFYFALKDSSTRINFGIIKWQPSSSVLSSVFLALDSFKITAFALILPFYLFLNRKGVWESLAFLVASITLLNGIVFFEPSLFFGYLSVLQNEMTLPNHSSPLWQTYEYVWYYTIPSSGILLSIASLRRNKRRKKKKESIDAECAAVPGVLSYRDGISDGYSL